LFDDGAVLGGSGDGDAASVAELEEAFVSELAAERTKVGVA
jgi:hypothetical protein